MSLLGVELKCSGNLIDPPELKNKATHSDAIDPFRNYHRIGRDFRRWTVVVTHWACVVVGVPADLPLSMFFPEFGHCLNQIVSKVRRQGIRRINGTLKILGVKGALAYRLVNCDSEAQGLSNSLAATTFFGRNLFEAIHSSS